MPQPSGIVRLAERIYPVVVFNIPQMADAPASNLRYTEDRTATGAVCIAQRCSRWTVRTSSIVVVTAPGDVMRTRWTMGAPAGRILEGNGIVPDLEVTLDRESLLQGRDAQLEAALAFLSE